MNTKLLKYRTLMSEQTNYDIVIVGAGLTGLTLACHLINQGLGIAILDRNNRHKVPVAELDRVPGYESDLRVSAITVGSQHFLEKCQFGIGCLKPVLHLFKVWKFGSKDQ